MEIVLFVMGVLQFAHWVNRNTLQLSVEVRFKRGSITTGPVAENPKRKRKAKPR